MSASPAFRCRRRAGSRAACVLVAFSVIAIAGCASVRYESSGRAPDAPVCQHAGETLSALVVWGPRWRPDQKDLADREAVARRGIERHFTTTDCYASVRVLRSSPGTATDEARSADALALARGGSEVPARVVVIVVRELGPTLILGGARAAVEGGTEVVLDIRVHETGSGRTLADFRAHWRHGGPWIVKGVATLEEDMVAALSAAFAPSRAR